MFALNILTEANKQLSFSFYETYTNASFFVLEPEQILYLKTKQQKQRKQTKINKNESIFLPSVYLLDILFIHLFSIVVFLVSFGVLFALIVHYLFLFLSQTVHLSFSFSVSVHSKSLCFSSYSVCISSTILSVLWLLFHLRFKRAACVHVSPI